MASQYSKFWCGTFVRNECVVLKSLLRIPSKSETKHHFWMSCVDAILQGGAVALNNILSRDPIQGSYPGCYARASESLGSEKPQLLHKFIELVFNNSRVKKPCLKK